MGNDKQLTSKIIGANQKNINRKFDTLTIDKEFLPIKDQQS